MLPRSPPREAIGAWRGGGAGRELHASLLPPSPAPPPHPECRRLGSTTGVAISDLVISMLGIEEADERDYAAARSGEHECIRTTVLRAHCTSDRARSCSPATL